MGREMKRQSLGQGLFLIGCMGSGERDTPRLRDLDGRDNIRFVAKNNEEFEPHRVWTLQSKSETTGHGKVGNPLALGARDREFEPRCPDLINTGSTRGIIGLGHTAYEVPDLVNRKLESRPGKTGCNVHGESMHHPTVRGRRSAECERTTP